MKLLKLCNVKMNYYVKIFDSPRSNILPETYSAKTIDLKIENQSLFAIYKLQNLRRVWVKLRDVRRANVWVEYSGNVFSSIIISFFLMILKNSLTLDCHNSAIEHTKGKSLRHLMSLLYLKIVQLAFGFKIVVHNKAIKKKVRAATVVHTPFPILPKVEKKSIENDILFLCSLNADEPMLLIMHLCMKLNEIGYRVRITGDPEKASIDELKEFMFDGYLSYDEYLVEVYSSKLTVSLTERPDTLLFAPREAIVLGVKCLINDTYINRDFYQKKVFYSSLDFNSMLDNIQTILEGV